MIDTLYKYNNSRQIYYLERVNNENMNGGDV